MQVVFISNEAITATDTYVCTGGTPITTKDGLYSLLNNVTDKSGNTIFVIDVHCAFITGTGENERQLKLQEQGGVIIYRHLLNKFKDCQDKLKVIFYSPISAKYLVALIQENYILKLLPFVEAKFEQDGQFANELAKVINDLDKKEVKPSVDNQDFSKGWLQFNNASENLLGGWSLNNESKVEVKKKEIVFVDDQAEEWRNTFEKVFKLGKGGVAVPEIFPYNKKSNQDRVFSLDKLDVSFAEKVRASDLVISDFYLEENHELNNWMSAEELSKKSGFQLFQAIKGTKDTRGIHKGVPIVMHTSSNKIQYYKFLDANGVDNWLVKDIRPDTTRQEKKENFIAFKTVIEEFTLGKSGNLYSILKGFWASIEIIEENTNSNWWYNHSGNIPNTDIPFRADINTKSPVISIIKGSWISLRDILNREVYLLENIGCFNNSFTAASICNNLGKLLEFFRFKQWMEYNYLFKFLYYIRNASSHYNDYNQLEKEDCIIYMNLWLTILNTDANNCDLFFARDDMKVYENIIQEDTESERAFLYGLLYAYLQYYNSSYSNRFTQIKESIDKRIEVLYLKADKTELFNEILINNGSTIPGGGRRKNLKAAISANLSQNSNPIELIKWEGKLYFTNA